jgi:molybdopterin synthase catalytic subunit
MLAVTGDPLSIDALTGAVEAAVRGRGEGCGALASFLGVVRATHQGRTVRYLEYEAFDALAVRTFEQIREETRARWPEAELALVHRVGRLEVGEASIAIVAAAAHRADAFAVCRYAIERVKQIAPVWKHEYFVDGDAWVDGAVADPDDTAAREKAMAIACA